MSPPEHIRVDLFARIACGNGVPRQCCPAAGCICPQLLAAHFAAKGVLRSEGLASRVQFTQQRLIARLTSFFGVLSRRLGLYRAIWSDHLQRRMPCHRDRRAYGLGAKRGDVVSPLLRGAFALIVLGLIIRLPLAAAAGKFLGSQLYGMNPYNPVVMLMAVMALGLSALVASLIPALRASLISPLKALRAE